MLSIATKTTAFAGRISTAFASVVFTRNSSFLGHLAPNDGAVVSYKRLGRGPASGKGKTSGRGQKGQKARSKVPRWLEGGQTPYYKRFPIIGFKRPHRKIYHPLNLDRVQDFWNNGRIPLQEGETLTIRTMRECGLITGTLKDGVKVLGNGKEEYNVPLNIEASRASAGAIRAIESLDKKFTAIYHTKLSLKAHINPDEFLLKKGHVPLHPRPTHRRDIEYYANPEKRGYLLENRALLLDHMENSAHVKKQTRKSHITRALEAASDKKHSDFVDKTTVSLSDL